MAPTCSECSKVLPPSKAKGAAERLVCSPVCRRARTVRLALEQWEVAVWAGTAFRTCAGCGETKELRRPQWPFSNGAPVGNYCFICFRHRKKNTYDAAYRAERKAAPLPPSFKRRIQSTAKLAKSAAAAVIQATRCPIDGLEANALREGAAAINDVAECLVAELVEHVNNPDSPRHLEAIKFFAERLIPMNAVNAQAVRMARDGEFDNLGRWKTNRPLVVVSVGLTTGPDKQ